VNNVHIDPDSGHNQVMETYIENVALESDRPVLEMAASAGKINKTGFGAPDT